MHSGTCSVLFGCSRSAASYYTGIHLLVSGPCTLCWSLHDCIAGGGKESQASRFEGPSEAAGPGRWGTAPGPLGFGHGTEEYERGNLITVPNHAKKPSKAVNGLCAQLTAHAADMVQLASYTVESSQQNVRANSCASCAIYAPCPLTDG